MFFRALALAAIFVSILEARGQEAFSADVARSRDENGNRIAVESAWLDLRQNAPTTSTTQSAPPWVEAVTLVPVSARPGLAAHTIFRIRVSRPRGSNFQLMLFRLFFEDKPEQRPTITAWDESGSQVLQSGALGAGIDLATSDTVLLPMIGVSCIDVDVPGDGTTIRGVFMDWMTSGNVAHPLSAERRDLIPEPFSAAPPLHVPQTDSENFGTVIATLAPETIRIGASMQQGAAFQFPLEAQPLMAMLSFEVAAARIDSPPEIFVNGENVGPVTLALPDLADPGYRGETERMIKPMRFRYTGWLRAQKLLPASNLRAGSNDLLVIGGPGTPASAIRATQIQLKYLWDKSDYILQTGP